MQKKGSINGDAGAGPSGLQPGRESVIQYAAPSGIQGAVGEGESSEWGSNDERWDAETVPNLTPGRNENDGSPTEPITPPEWDSEDEIPLSAIREKLRETKECTVVLRHFEFTEQSASDSSMESE